eukprot:scaffold2784_cov101-Isochrysis_galbana.AAC.2
MGESRTSARAPVRLCASAAAAEAKAKRKKPSYACAHNVDGQDGGVREGAEHEYAAAQRTFYVYVLVLGLGIGRCVFGPATATAGPAVAGRG